MSRRVVCVLLSAIAVIPLCALALMLAVPANAATACNAAPSSPPPQGNHWYYRTDRVLGRKCWYLAAEGQKVVPSRPAMRAPTRAGPAAPPAETSAEQVTRPAGLRLAEPSLPHSEQIGMAGAPAAPVARDVLDSAERSTQPASGLGVPERTEERAQIFGSLDDRPTQPFVPAAEVARASAPAPAPFSTFQIALLVFAAISFLASSVLHLAGARRRSTQIKIVDLNAKAPLRAPVAVPSMTTLRREPAADNDVAVDEERLRRFAQAWKQQAA